jgi:hypothetical protein
VPISTDGDLGGRERSHFDFAGLPPVRTGSSDRGLSVGVRHGRWLGQQLFAFGVQSADEWALERRLIAFPKAQDKAS